jgi:hypothetical protein
VSGLALGSRPSDVCELLRSATLSVSRVTCLDGGASAFVEFSDEDAVVRAATAVSLRSAGLEVGVPA